MHTVSLALLFVFGACLGSFGSVVVSRVPQGKSIGGRSQCPHCHKKIPVMDLIPIASFFALRGRCRQCEAPISLRYPFLEAGSGILFILPSITEGYVDPFTVSLGCAFWFFMILTLIDADHKSIPDAVSIPFLLITLLAAVLRGDTAWMAPVIGGGFFFVQWAASRGRIMGSGDVLIGIAMGMTLGTWQHTLLAVGVAYVVGALVVSAALLSHALRRKDRIAFIPFLFAGTITSFLAGDWLIRLLVL